MASSAPAPCCCRPAMPPRRPSRGAIGRARRRSPASPNRSSPARSPNGAACGVASAVPAPDVFEPGRMNAVGIFLGRRAGEGYSVNILSTSRRRDRIVVVFEERMPAEFMMAQRAPAPSAPRPVASAPSAPSGFARWRRRRLRAVRHGRQPRASPAARDPSGRPADLAVGDHPDHRAPTCRSPSSSGCFDKAGALESAARLNASAGARPWSRRSSDS